ncbi:MAG: bifunctional proline dehydrogenase/L-glutamate gamma-semialdehyde dehydrogenase PutA [Gammaproteobacteria bacterium]|nr:bifunctional proline dehydrogenase/L-glutamate gamma-semialdehyde dehydrogenase PutA [Gammaproteobacteria bacterium]
MKFTSQPFGQANTAVPVSRGYLADEQDLVARLAEVADGGEALRRRVHDTAAGLVRAVRKNAAEEGGIDAFLQQYDLSSVEGVLLMCIAEELLRIADADSADRLIADKITSANWQDHIGESESLFVNASTWGLMLTGQLLKTEEVVRSNPARLLTRLAGRAGEPVVRTAMRQAMRIMGFQFVMGRDIDEAMQRSRKKENRAYRYSFDMLGEAALTAADAERFFESYAAAIERIGAGAGSFDDIFSAPGISVKLSALHPRYSFTHHERVMTELADRVLALAVTARDAGIAMTIDAEEADRLEISLELFGQVYRSTRLRDYEGLGLAVQAYQRRATDVIDFLSETSASQGRRIPVRLVKGAYWDTEIKLAQESGLKSYPVFTRKSHSDVSYLACARRLLDAKVRIYPQFATHNAHTLSSVLHFAGARSDYEFQRLHGMGEELYAEVIDTDKFNRPCRVYAPVGSHEDLLPYLVRRLLENGANTSFVNRIIDSSVDVDEIVADPIEQARSHDFEPHPAIPQPPDIFMPERVNSASVNLADKLDAEPLLQAMQAVAFGARKATPIVSGRSLDGTAIESVNPANAAESLGVCHQATVQAVDTALAAASRAQPGWDRTPAAGRADCLRRAADLYEQHMAELMALCVAEAGKTIPDALSELREAVDFLRYYAARAEAQFGEPSVLPGPTGERNTFGLRGRGTFVCISPWNFPLAIFTGQVSAAVAAGNAVLAKPAEQTPLVAHRAVELLLDAGIPEDILHFLPGDGATIGAAAVADSRVAGVAFTGSTDTARVINQSLAKRAGPIATFIAETGGQNAMFVDSSALPEQVVLDSVFSAFNSAGQRCSALRVLCLQKEIAPRVIELLEGHMRELSIGDPSLLSTDVGPAIDEEARGMLQAHVERLGSSQREIFRCELPPECHSGTFFPPVAYEIEGLDVLQKEVFGPVLHVLRYKGNRLAETVEAVNSTGFGLTMGLHSRIDRRAKALVQHSGAGNIYVNRNMIGAVVGVQPFGGRGLSGTGPKAGGPNYLPRFASEYTVSNNISAVGGNASLLSLETD